MKRNSDSCTLSTINNQRNEHNQRILHVRIRMRIDREIETSYDDTMMAIIRPSISKMNANN